MEITLLVNTDESLEFFYYRPEIVALNDLELQLIHVDFARIIQLWRRDMNGFYHINIPCNLARGIAS